MRAAVIDKLNEPLTVRDVPDPVCPPDGAIVRVEANGICRTDWALWAGNFWTGGPELSLPFVLGHEFAGTIEETGADVRGWRKGDRRREPRLPLHGRLPRAHRPGAGAWRGVGGGARGRRRDGAGRGPDRGGGGGQRRRRRHLRGQARRRA